MDRMEPLVELMHGDMTPALRVWAALAPALLVSGWFLGGLAVFAIRSALWGVPRDDETIQRGGSLLVGEYLRHYFFWLMRPAWRAVERSGIPPTALTTLSVLLAFGSGVSAAAGRFALAGWLFIFSGILDTFDGRLARLRQTATPWGAAIDSTLDRWADSAVLAGLGWYYRDTWVLVPVLLSMIGTAVVPYVRARGEGLGVLVKDGLMQRAERVLYLGAAVALSPVVEALRAPNDPRPMHWLAAVALCALAVSSNYTGVVRLRAVVNALREKAGTPAPPVGPSLGRFGLNAFAAALATGVDFAVALTLVWVGLGPFIATAGGCAVGALVNFGFNRAVTFRSRAAPLAQAGRYALVSLTSLGLNAGGVALLLSLPALSYSVAWWVVRCAVFVLWNYPLHSGYVFADPDLERRIVV
jgi:phosphatidylglycerophosphate synthase/putative flippase GtrA